MSLTRKSIAGCHTLIKKNLAGCQLFLDYLLGVLYKAGRGRLNFITGSRAAERRAFDRAGMV
jgi:hypothetical protein